jgi:hypothetical protein
MSTGAGSLGAGAFCAKAGGCADSENITNVKKHPEKILDIITPLLNPALMHSGIITDSKKSKCFAGKIFNSFSGCLREYSLCARRRMARRFARASRTR